MQNTPTDQFWFWPVSVTKSPRKTKKETCGILAMRPSHLHIEWKWNFACGEFFVFFFDWRIITLNTVIQSSQEFQRPIWIAFVDLKAAFDSLDCNPSWKLLHSLGLHSKVVDFMEAWHMDTCSCVCADGMLSDWFAVGSGVRQGCLAGLTCS